VIGPKTLTVEEVDLKD